MLVRQFVFKGLGNTAHVLAPPEHGLGAVIDPLRDVDLYLASAHREGLRITVVLDTHVHNDFVSGSRELAARTGATLYAPAGSGIAFPHTPLADRGTVQLGRLRLEAIATPGHTPEHMSYLVSEGDSARPLAVFTGGSLMVGTVGRSDLLGPELTHQLLRDQYHSVRARLLTLPDDVLVYPTHGAGSLCAASGGSERVTTIGAERARNPVALTPDAEAFAAIALTGLPPYPDYFRRMRPLNQRGPAPIGELPLLRPLKPDELAGELAAGTLLVDTRDSWSFDAGHIPGSLAIGIAPQFGTWLGWVVPEGTRLALVAGGPAEREEIVRQAVRVGYEDFAGYLAGGVAAWERSGRPLRTIPLVEQGETLANGLTIVDVRHPSEWQEGHIPGAVHLPLGDLPKLHVPLPHDRPLVVHCAHEYRSALALSLLERAGYTDLRHLAGGFDAWREAGLPVA